MDELEINLPFDHQVIGMAKSKKGDMYLIVFRLDESRNPFIVYRYDPATLAVGIATYCETADHAFRILLERAGWSGSFATL